MPGILRFLLFFFVSGALLFAINAFLYRRLAADLTTNRHLRKAAVVTLAVLTVGSLCARLLATFVPAIGGRVVVTALLIWWGVALYVTLALLPFELPRAFRWWRARRSKPSGPAADGAPTRRDALVKLAAGTAFVVGGGVAVFGARSAFAKPEVSQVALKLARLPKALDGLKIIHLTDIHVGALIQERFLDTLVEVANSQKPDLVAITGDLVDGRVSVMGRYVKTLQKLRSRYGTFFVTGNHDYYSGADEWCAALEGLGMTVLRNRAVQVGDAAASIDLVGVNDPIGSVTGANSAAFEQAFAGRDADRATVVLAHRPNDFVHAVRRGADLQLSGHTHGGQMFPATLISDAIWGPWSRGLSRSQTSYLYVGRGCGFVGPPLRVGSPPEVASLTLVAG